MFHPENRSLLTRRLPDGRRRSNGEIREAIEVALRSKKFDLLAAGSLYAQDTKAEARATLFYMTIRVFSDYDGGSIEIIDASSASDIRVRLKIDPTSDNEGEKIFRQHFDFTVESADGLSCVKITIEDVQLSMCSFEGYFAMYWTDHSKSWGRTKDTRLIKGESSDSLVVEFNAGSLSTVVDGDLRECKQLRVAYFEPFSYDVQHAQLIERCCRHPLVKRRCVGVTQRGREVDLLCIGHDDSVDAAKDKNKKASVWIICRQHPSETMAEHWAQGFLERLLGDGPDDDRDVICRRPRSSSSRTRTQTAARWA